MRISDWSSDVCSSDLKGGRKAARSRAARQLEYERKRASENNGVWDCQRSTRLYEKHRPSVPIGDHSRRRRPPPESQIALGIGLGATPSVPAQLSGDRVTPRFEL